MNLKDEFKIIIEFAKDCPKSLFDQKKPLLSYTKHDKKKFKYMDAQHLKMLEKKFINGRVKNLKPPQTIADFAVYAFLKKEKNYSKQEIRKVIEYHYEAMGVENIIGHYLEEFINTFKEDQNLIWCSGSVANKMDFIQKIKKNGKVFWKAFQIKNSSNTENSSSKTVRDDTDVIIWCRRNANKKNNQNWPFLQKKINSKKFTERNFLKFIKSKARN